LGLCIQNVVSAYIQMLQEVEVEFNVSEGGEAWPNGYAERPIHNIKDSNSKYDQEVVEWGGHDR